MSTLSTNKTREKIRQYWDERAQAYQGTTASTTDDIHLRELEIKTMIETLKEAAPRSEATVLDVGCGDGYSTTQIALALPRLKFLGIDYSQTMIDIAAQRLQLGVKGRVEFKVGDVTELRKACGHEKYDIVISDRCLINLESTESQYDAVAQIAKHTKPGGLFVPIENFVEGQEKLNSARRAVGVPEIPIRWHNLYFYESDFIKNVERFFANITFKDFASSYYFATRVVYSAMCQMRGERLDYDHQIHRLAVNLPWFDKFSPIRMAVMNRK